MTILHRFQGDELNRLLSMYPDIVCNITAVTLLPYNWTLRSRGHPRIHLALASDALKLVMTSFSLVLRGAQGVNMNISDSGLRNELHRVIINVSPVSEIRFIYFQGQATSLPQKLLRFILLLVVATTATAKSELHTCTACTAATYNY